MSPHKMEMSNMCLAGLSSYSSSILTHTRVLSSEFLDILDHFQPTNNHLATTLTQKTSTKKNWGGGGLGPLPSPHLTSIFFLSCIYMEI